MITWRGRFDNTGAIPTSNIHLLNALVSRGADVLMNEHNWDNKLSDVLVSFTYPPKRINIKHDANVVIAAWEFWGDETVPMSFRRVFDDYDLVLGISQWNAQLFAAATQTRVSHIPLGIDAHQFNPAVERADWSALLKTKQIGERMLLWVGGSDERHGFDVALDMLDYLPDEYHLVAKRSKNYPNAYARAHKHTGRIHILHEDLESLAPLYRAADALVMTARGVGCSLPVLEAVACGTRVISTPLPPVREYANESVYFAGDFVLEPYYHHPVHSDCRPFWLVPDAEALAAATLDATKDDYFRTVSLDWMEAHSWETSAAHLLRTLEEEFEYVLPRY